MKTFYAAILAMLLLAIPAKGGVIYNPVRHTGADAIDPAGSQQITANQLGGGATQAILEARSDFGVVQDWAGFTAWGGNSANTNILAFSDIRPDVEFRVNNLSGTVFSEYGEAFNTAATHATSGTSSIRTGFVPGVVTSTNTFTMSFGTFDGTNFFYDQAVEAVGFTLNNINGGTNSATDTTRYRVDFQNAAGDSLFISAWVDVNTMPRDTADNRPNIFFAHMVDPNTPLEDWIARVVVREERRGAANGGNQMAFDDFGFTATLVPEPSSLLLFITVGTAAVVWCVRRRVSKR